MTLGRTIRRTIMPVVLLVAGVGLAVVIVDSRPEEETLELGTGFTSVERRTVQTTETFAGTIRFDGELTVAHTSTVGPASSSTEAEVVTWVVSAGDEAVTGTVLYRVDTRPVVVLDGEIPAYRTLEDGVDGADVAQLQAALVVAGFDPDGLVEIDGGFGPRTEEMVESWQAAMGADVDGSVALGEVVFQPGPARVSSVMVEVGTEIPDGSPVLRLTSEQRIVDVDAPADLVHLLTAGAEVDIRLPDRSVVAGTVLAVASVVDPETSTVRVRVVSEELADANDQAPATVLVDRVLVADAFVVESEAILSTLNDGYVLEVIGADGSTSRLPVTVGATDGVVVAVEADGLVAGTLVVAPV